MESHKKSNKLKTVISVSRKEEISASRSLGEEDTVSQGDEDRDSFSSAPKSDGSHPVKLPWNNLFKKNIIPDSDDVRLRFIEPTDGTAAVKKDEEITIEQEKQFALLGCFVGKFPGMWSVSAMVKSWGLECKSYAKPNGFVLFKFSNSADRDKILNGDDQYVFGRKLYLRPLPEDYLLENCDFCSIPTWVKLPGLPKALWHLTALSRIASCIGNPVCVDTVTKERSRSAYARVLVFVDSSDARVESVSITREEGPPLQQPVVYEYLPAFCPKCCSRGHLSEDCEPRWKHRNSERQVPSDQLEDDSRPAPLKEVTSSPAIDIVARAAEGEIIANNDLVREASKAAESAHSALQGLAKAQSLTRGQSERAQTTSNQGRSLDDQSRGEPAKAKQAFGTVDSALPTCSGSVQRRIIPTKIPDKQISQKTQIRKEKVEKVRKVLKPTGKEKEDDKELKSKSKKKVKGATIEQSENRFSVLVTRPSGDKRMAGGGGTKVPTSAPQ